MAIGFGPSVKNVATKKSHQLATVSWQQPSVGNVKKMSEGQPHPHALLKCETIFFVMNGMQQVYSG
jgi:hypothetical protein